MVDRPLAGRRVVTTRDERGRLDTLLAAAGADVVHVPLIEIRDPADAGRALARALADLADIDWLIVTSRHGAARTGEAAGAHPRLRLAAVGTRTAAQLAELAGRPVDLVPERHTAADLLAAMPPPTSGSHRVLIAQADRADGALAAGLAKKGYDVAAVTAYVTAMRRPTAFERVAALAADAVTFASGSAAESWVAAFGTAAPPVVVAIGPTTERAALDAGLQISRVAADHTVEGLVAAVATALREHP